MKSIGTWWLRSKEDPRWDCSGRDDVGSFVMSNKCKEKLEELKKLYREPPKDLEFGYMKD